MFACQKVVAICRSNLVTEEKKNHVVCILTSQTALGHLWSKIKKKKQNLAHLLSLRIIFFHSYVSQQAGKHLISLVWSIWQQVFSSPDGKDRISTAYISGLLPYNFVGPDSGMHVNLSLSICLHLIKHMFKSFLEKGCFPEKRSWVMLFSASDTEFSQ